MALRVRPLALLALLSVIAAIHPGCLCVDSRERSKEPEETTQDKLKDCMKDCDFARWSCQNGCNRDDTCSRACVAAYDKCIDICGGKR